jgi:hypothetical protein
MIRRSRIGKTHRPNHAGVLSGYTYLAGTTFPTIREDACGEGGEDRFLLPTNFSY